MQENDVIKLIVEGWKVTYAINNISQGVAYKFSEEDIQHKIKPFLFIKNPNDKIIIMKGTTVD